MYLAGHPREEISSLLGWSEAKTRNLLYRGLADLRGCLTAQGIGWGGGKVTEKELQDLYGQALRSAQSDLRTCSP